MPSFLQTPLSVPAGLGNLPELADLEGPSVFPEPTLKPGLDLSGVLLLPGDLKAARLIGTAHNLDPTVPS